jgi:hypothetical protein
MNLREPRPGEAEAYQTMLRRAVRDGLASKLSLDALLRATGLWLEPSSLRAKLGEQYPAAREYGLAFVPATRWIHEAAYTVAPFHDADSEYPVVLCAVPKTTMHQVRAAPQDDRVKKLFEIEAQRIAAMFDARGLPLPPEVAQFFAGGEGEEDTT